MPTDYAAAVLVRLTAEDLQVLQAIQLPGEPRAHAYLRAARHIVVTPLTVMLRYRKAPMFKAWLEQGPMSVVDAELRGARLVSNGFEVEAVVVDVPA